MKPSSHKGQTLIECVLLIPVIVIVISGIFLFAQAMLTKQQLIMAARYGTDLMAYTDMDEEMIREEITVFLCDSDEKGRKLDPGNLRIELRKEGFPEIDRVSSLGGMASATQLFNLLLFPEQHTSYVKVYYDISIPGIFTAWNRFLPGEFPESLVVGARSEVLVGTGTANH